MKISVSSILNDIGSGAFHNTKPVEFTWSENVTTIKEKVFKNSTLGKFSCDFPIYRIARSSFKGIKIKELIVPSDCGIIERKTFANIQNTLEIFFLKRKKSDYLTRMLLLILYV